MNTILRGAMAAALLILVAGAPAQDAPGAPTPAPPPSTETSYNPRGTRAESEIGLISNRRDDPEFRGFLLGIQAAAIASLGGPLNVAPLSEATLDEQAAYLETHHGVKVFVVDAPIGGETVDFYEDSVEKGRRITYITHGLPEGIRPPGVGESQQIYGEVVAEEIIRQFGNVPVRIGVLNIAKYRDAPEGSLERQRWETFIRVFQNVADKMEVVPFDPAAHQPGFNEPAGIVALSAADSLAHVETLRGTVPSAKIVLIGDSDKMRHALEEGLYDVRVRPDHYRLLMFSLGEEKRRTDMPIVLRPMGEKRPTN